MPLNFTVDPERKLDPLIAMTAPAPAVVGELLVTEGAAAKDKFAAGKIETIKEKNVIKIKRIRDLTCTEA